MITIIDYGAGNLRSVQNAFDAIDQPTRITNNPEELEEASAIVLPGVGAFGEGIQRLHQLELIDALNEQVLHPKFQKPFLGICLGLQFLADASTELGEHTGLGWISGKIERIQPSEPEFRIPHIGWNEIDIHQPSPLFQNFEEAPIFYFVHSFHFLPREGSPDPIIATCQHGTRVTAAIELENIHAVQFHPEKSQQVGLQLLKNFANLA